MVLFSFVGISFFFPVVVSCAFCGICYFCCCWFTNLSLREVDKVPAAVATLLVVVVVFVVVCLTKPDWKFEQVAAVEMHSLNQQQKAFFEAK